MDVFRVRDQLIEDYRDFTGSFVEIHDERIARACRERMDNGLSVAGPVAVAEPDLRVRRHGHRAGRRRACCTPSASGSSGCKETSDPAGADAPSAPAPARGDRGGPHRRQLRADDRHRLGQVPGLHRADRRPGAARQGDGQLPAGRQGDRRLPDERAGEQPGAASWRSSSARLPATASRRSPSPATPARSQPTSGDEILADPPDILLTNYVMLELVLTRPRRARQLIAAAQGLRFLVLDELHTYRGRQGADVAMLVRRLRDDLRGAGPAVRRHVGDDGLAAAGDAEQTQAVAEVATTLFGADGHAERVIGETLERATDPAAVTPERRWPSSGCRRGRLPPEDYAAFVDDPLAGWIEADLRLRAGQRRRLARAAPPPADGARRRPPSWPSGPAATAGRLHAAIRQILQAGSRDSATRLRAGRCSRSGCTSSCPRATPSTSPRAAGRAARHGHLSGRGPTPDRRAGPVLLPLGVLPRVRPGLSGRRPDRRPGHGSAMRPGRTTTPAAATRAGGIPVRQRRPGLADVPRQS